MSPASLHLLAPVNGVPIEDRSTGFPYGVLRVHVDGRTFDCGTAHYSHPIAVECAQAMAGIQHTRRVRIITRPPNWRKS